MIDTHAHLYMFDNDGEEIIQKMNNDNLDYIVTIGTNIEDSKKNIEIAEKYENIYATVGIYPEFSKETTDDDLMVIKELAKHKKVVAIGEIGLDFHHEGFDKESQKELLVKQLKLADELGLPICIHCRNAGEELYNILKENKKYLNHSGVMHCYSEGKEYFKKFLDLGFYLSFSGNITYKKTDRSFLKDIPLDKILVETDSPFLSPEPLRGRRNEPKNVRFIIDKIAFEVGVSPAEFERITTKNAKMFYFNIK